MKNPFILLPAIAIASCAAPKARIIYEVPGGLKENEPAIASAKPRPAAEPTRAPAGPPASSRGVAGGDDSDSLRLPDMLALPDQNQLHGTAPSTPPAGEATIITRPPRE